MNDFIKYYAKNNFLTQKKMKEIDAFYKLDKNALLEKYNAEFLKVFRAAITHSPFYKNLYGQHGVQITDIKDITDIKKLPITTREDLQDKEDQIFFGNKKLKINGYTSGTTGTPLVIYRTPLNVINEQAYAFYYRLINGYKMGQKYLSIRGTLDRNTTHKYFKRANTLYISSPNINEGTIDFYYKLIKNHNPVAVEAFPSYLYKICQELEKKGLEWHVPNAFTSSETLYDFERQKIENFLQTKIHDLYGNAERTIMLTKGKDDKYSPAPLYSINEFEEEQIITTALTNIKFPFIRYAVRDKIVVNGNDFMQNIVAPDIVRIEGRSTDTLDLKDGSIVGCIDHAFKGLHHLEYAQVHQYTVQEPIEIKMVVRPDFGSNDLELFKSKFVNMVGKDTPYFITYCKRENLTFSSVNKFKLVIKHNKPRK